MVRSRGYSIFCTLLGATFTAVGVGAALDPTTPPSGDPAWLGWALLAVVACFVARSWFIGLRVTGATVVRTGWLRRSTVSVADIRVVGSADYSGSWVAHTALFSMVVLRLQDGREVEVPELAGRPDTVWSMVDELNGTLGVTPRRGRRAGR